MIAALVNQSQNSVDEAGPSAGPSTGPNRTPARSATPGGNATSSNANNAGSGTRNNTSPRQGEFSYFLLIPYFIISAMIWLF